MLWGYNYDQNEHEVALCYVDINSNFNLIDQYSELVIKPFESQIRRFYLVSKNSLINHLIDVSAYTESINKEALDIKIRINYWGYDRKNFTDHSVNYLHTIGDDFIIPIDILIINNNTVDVKSLFNININIQEIN